MPAGQARRAAQWESYSPISQTVSELSAIGAPTRALWEWLVAPYTLLVIVFGRGVWISADANRALRAGTLITVYGALGLAWPFAPMHQRETLAAGGSTVSDTLHLVLGAVTVLLMPMAITFAAAAFGKWFRVFVRDIGDSFCIWRTEFSGRAEYWHQSSNAVGGTMGTDKYRCFPAVDLSAGGENVVAGGLATCSLVGSVADEVVEIICSTPGCITATGLGGLNASNGSEE